MNTAEPLHATALNTADVAYNGCTAVFVFWQFFWLM